MELTGLVGGIQKFSAGDGPGIRTTVFLQGCPMRCAWCHNPELVDPSPRLMHVAGRCIRCCSCAAVCPSGSIGICGGEPTLDRDSCQGCFRCARACYCEAMRPSARIMTLTEVMRLVEQDRDFYQRTNGGMTISGGECMEQYQFTLALAKEAGARGIGVAIDTCGFAAQGHMIEIAGLAQWLLYDIKAISDAVHKKYTGVSNQPILDNLRRLAAEPELRNKVQVRLPLIGGINDSQEMIGETIQFLKENSLKNVALLPYHDIGASKYTSLAQGFRSFSPPQKERLNEITANLNAAGIQNDDGAPEDKQFPSVLVPSAAQAV